MDKKWGIKIEKLRLSGEKRSKRGEMVKKNGENKQRWVILRLSGDKRGEGRITCQMPLPPSCFHAHTKLPRFSILLDFSFFCQMQVYLPSINLKYIIILKKITVKVFKLFKSRSLLAQKKILLVLKKNNDSRNKAKNWS